MATNLRSSTGATSRQTTRSSQTNVYSHGSICAGRWNQPIPTSGHYIQLAQPQYTSSLRPTRSHAAHSTGVASADTYASTSGNQKSVPKSLVWEIDFCSRPLLDERNKKIWELLICDTDRTFEYSEYFPNSKINSAEVSCLRSYQPRPACTQHVLTSLTREAVRGYP